MFIVFEGLDGSGKTTQLSKLADMLKQRKVKCITTQEPTDFPTGVLIREALRKNVEFLPETLALLFAADRFEHVNKAILPELNKGVSVLCHRFVFSNLAFQGLAMPMDKVLAYNRSALDLLMPDLTVFVDTPPDLCIRRIHRERENIELFEREDILRAVRENYLRAFEMLPDTEVWRIDGDRPEEEVFADIWEKQTGGGLSRLLTRYI